MSNSKNQEQEIKFQIPHISQSNMTVLLAKVGFKFDHVENQTDVYYDIPGNGYPITNLKRGLRLRYDNGLVKSLQFKSLFMSDTGTFFVEEQNLLDKVGNIRIKEIIHILNDRLNLNLPAGELSDRIEDSLVSMGLTPSIVIKKTRYLYINKSKTIEISHDQIENLGDFVEVELIVSAETKFDDVCQNIRNLFSDTQLITCGYLDLILDKNPKIHSKTEFEELYRKDYNWNVMPNELSLVKKLFAK